MDKTSTLLHLLSIPPEEFAAILAELPDDEPHLLDEIAPGEEVIRFLLHYSMALEILPSSSSEGIAYFKN